MGAIMGAMLCANSTQTGFSGSTVPSPGSTVWPLRTISAKRRNGSDRSGCPKNREMEAMQAGDRGSRNVALVGVLR